MMTSTLSSEWHYDRDGPGCDWLELSSGMETSVGFGSACSTASGGIALRTTESMRNDVMVAIREAIIAIEFSQLRPWREKASPFACCPTLALD